MPTQQQKRLVLGDDPQLRYTRRVKALGPIAYWPLAESGGTSALDASGYGRNGVYTGVTLGSPGIGDGRTAASWNGSTSYCNVYGASLNAAFSGQEGTWAGWFQPSAVGIWTGTTSYELIMLQSSASNLIRLFKTGTANQLFARYVAGATTKTTTITVASNTNWVHFAMTWSKVADQWIAYLNGAAVGAPATALGTYVGSLAPTTAVIGASSTAPVAPWSGLAAHNAIWSTPLSAAQIASLATV